MSTIVDEADRAEEGARRSAENTPHEESSERSPLLNRRFLDPDDPEVTPLNVPLVRALRIVLFGVLIALSVFDIVLFINIFVSFHGGDSGFQEFLFVLLSILSVATSLAFFSVPDKADRVLLYSTAFVFAVITVLSLSFTQPRHQMSFYGIITSAIVAVVYFSTAVIEGIVFQGKRSEEIRLTGRVENRRSLWEWLKVSVLFISRFLLLCVAILFLGGNLLYGLEGGVGHSEDLTNLVAVKYGHLKESRINLYCTPETHKAKFSNLTVLVEADATTAYEASSWVVDLYDIHKSPRVCFWDRPGRGASDIIGDDDWVGVLEKGLKKEGLLTNDNDTKFVLVSHGSGFIYSSIFAGRYPEKVAALFTVDGEHPTGFYRTRTAWAGFEHFLHGLWSVFPIERLASLGDHQFSFRKAGVGSDHYQTDNYCKSRLQEQIFARKGTKQQVEHASSVLSSTNIPLVVVSAGDSISKNKDWSDEQRQLSQYTKNNLAWEILDGPHNLWKLEGSKSKLQSLFINLVDKIAT